MSVPDSPPPGTPLALLRQAHRRQRLTLLLWSLVAMVAAVAVTLAESSNRIPVVPFLSTLAALVSAVLLVLWLRRVRTLSAQDTACRLDERWALQARLESALELENSPTGLAARQRDEAAGQVAGRRPPHNASWYSALTLLGTAALLSLGLLLTGPRLGIPGISAPTPPPAGKAGATPDETKPPEPEKPTPPKPVEKIDTLAEIRWIEPESETKATAIEELWLKAAAETHSGLRNATLEISVNGERPIAQPLSAENARLLSEPGEPRLEHALYLDELKVGEFDIVSYFISAEPIGAPAAATVRSPMQFIQIRAAREDRALSKGEGDSFDLPLLLITLKTAQLRLLKQNFLLADPGVNHTEPLWKEHNPAVASEQKILATKTLELRTLGIENGAPAQIIDNLTRIPPLMEQASAQINDEHNAAALPVQQHALALITDCERTLKKAAGGPQSPITDPFRDKQELDLPPRKATTAGQIEQLAQKQSDVVNELGQSKSDAAKTTERQGEIAFQAQQLSEKPGLSDKTKESLAKAAQAAQQAVQRLAQNDPRSALAPAAEAEGALREAAEEMARAGARAAQAALEDERRAFNAAGRETSGTVRAEAVRAAAARLAQEALAQQETGSEAGARQLATAAERIRQAASSAPGDAKWNAAVDTAAQAQVALSSSGEAVRRTLRQVQRGKAGLAAGDTGTGQAEAELGAQLAVAQLGQPAEHASAEALRAALSGYSDTPTNRERLLLLFGAVEQALTRLQSDSTRDERVRRFDPDAIDPAYRPAVENYFERLSREAGQP